MDIEPRKLSDTISGLKKVGEEKVCKTLAKYLRNLSGELQGRFIRSKAVFCKHSGYL